MINEGYHNLTSRERQSYTEKVRQSYTKTVRQNNRVIGAALRRAAMLLCMIIMGVGGAKAEETELTTGTDNGCLTISADQFSGINETSILRIYETADGEIYIATTWSWTPMYTPNGHILSGSSFYNSTKKSIELKEVIS